MGGTDGRFRYACLWVPGFPAVAFVRRDPSLRGRPLAVLSAPSAALRKAPIRSGGRPATPGRVVLDVTREAWIRGVRPGMSVGEARARGADLVCRDRDPEAEESAAEALIDVALSVSPRLEVVQPGWLHVELTGLPAPGSGRSETWFGAQLSLGAASLDLKARVGIASTRTVADLAARAGRDITVVAPGEDAAYLAPLPVAWLDPSPDLALTLGRWGIRTLAELAALPPDGMLARLGPAGARLRRRARGEDDGPFVPYHPRDAWAEALTLDWEVVSLEALVFVLRRLLDRLLARLALHQAGAAALTLTAGLADGATATRHLPLAAPLREPRTVLGLLRADLERLTLSAPIVTLRLEAEAAPLRPVQADLSQPSRPSPAELGELLGRLSGLVTGVGAPSLDDSHRPDAAQVVPFTGSAVRTAAVAALTSTDALGLVCRRFVPPLPAVVRTRRVREEPGAMAGPGGAPEQRPARVAANGVRGDVVACAGPWRTTGEWWTDTPWAREEWDVALTDGAAYRLALDLGVRRWTVEAVYD